MNLKKLLMRMAALTVLFCLIVPVSSHAAVKPKVPNISEDVSNVLDQIDIYITRVDEANYHNVDKAGVDYVELYSARIKQGENQANIQVSETARIKKLSKNEVREQANNPIIKLALEKAQRQIDLGLVVNYVNVILPDSNEMQVTTSSDEDFWLNNSIYWDYYRGYHFRYLWTELDVRTDTIRVGNMPSSSTTWENVKQAAYSVLVNRILDEMTYGVWSAMIDIADVLGSATTFNVYFNPQNEYIEGLSRGTLYFRDIIIEDVHDKISGHSYYPWGYVTKLEHCSDITVKYIKLVKPDGSNDYGYADALSPVIASKSPNYDDKYAIFDNVIEYYNYLGYQQYYEDLDLDEIPFLRWD